MLKSGDQDVSPAEERNDMEKWSLFAEEALRNDAVIEESSTDSREIPSSSGAGNVETPLSKVLVGERTSPFRGIRSVYGGDGLPDMHSPTSGFIPPNSELLLVPARRSLSGVFGGSEGHPKADVFDPSWNRDTLRSFSAGPSQPLDPHYPSSPHISVGFGRPS